MLTSSNPFYIFVVLHLSSINCSYNSGENSFLPLISEIVFCIPHNKTIFHRCGNANCGCLIYWQLADSQQWGGKQVRSLLGAAVAKGLSSLSPNEQALSSLNFDNLWKKRFAILVHGQVTNFSVGLFYTYIGGGGPRSLISRHDANGMWQYAGYYTSTRGYISS